MEEIRRKLERQILEQMDYRKDISDEDIAEMIDSAIVNLEELACCPVSQRIRLKTDLFNSLRRLDLLQIFVEDEEVTEIMINGKDTIFLEKSGRLVRYPRGFDSAEKLMDVIQMIVAGCNRVINTSAPIVDARLEGGARIHVVLPPISLNGPVVTIRRFPKDPITMDWLIRKNSITASAAELLRKLVLSGYNIFISGGTGSGKTTFLNALSQFIPEENRVITIEDSAELQLQGLPNLVRLETRNANAEGCQVISIRDLIKASLRMRPDRIIVGEVRGAEAFDMLQCMNTGHDGSMSTGHANSARDMLSRLENMVLMGIELPLPAIRQQIASGIDILVHLGRLRDHSRRVLSIEEVVGFRENEIQMNSLYQFEEMGTDEKGMVIGSLVEKGELVRKTKLQAAGLS
ncbi:MAG: CpaF family protein [Acetatifactor sp.]